MQIYYDEEEECVDEGKDAENWVYCYMLNNTILCILQSAKYSTV